MSKGFILLLLTILLLISGCTKIPPPAEEIKPQKGDTLLKTYGKKPVIPPPSDYFVGISREWDNESDARKEALNDAFRQILGYIGVNVSVQEIQELIETLKREEEVAVPEIFTKKISRSRRKSLFRDKTRERIHRGMEKDYTIWGKLLL